MKCLIIYSATINIKNSASNNCIFLSLHPDAGVGIFRFQRIEKFMDNSSWFIVKMAINYEPSTIN